MMSKVFDKKIKIYSIEIKKGKILIKRKKCNKEWQYGKKRINSRTKKGNGNEI